MTRWLATTMTVEAANGDGVPGDDLAAVTCTSAGAPPFGYLLAARIINYDNSPGAACSSPTPPPRRPRRWRAPRRVRLAGVVPMRLLAGGPCTSFALFIQDQIVAVANAPRRSNTSGGGLFGILGRIWNAAVDLAAGLAKGLIDAITGSIGG